MRIGVETLFSSAAVAAGPTFKLGVGAKPGNTSEGIADPTVFIDVTGISNVATSIKIQGSVDNTNWRDWITPITANGMYIIEKPALYLRGNLTANTATDTVIALIQQYLEK